MEQINSIILTKIDKYRKENIEEIFEDLYKSFTKGYIYIFIEDLQTNILVKAHRYEVSNSNIESLKKFKEKIMEKLVYYNRYQNKYFLHFYFIKKKRFKEFLFPNEINSIYKKVVNYYNLSNELSNFKRFFIQMADYYIKHPIQITSGFITIILSYILIDMYIKGLKPEEIEMTTLSSTIELFIAIIGFFVIIFFIGLFLPIKWIGINFKVVLGSFFVFFILILVIIFVIREKNQKPFSDYIIEQYFLFKKYPRFAILEIENNGHKTKKYVLIRFIRNKYIYYNNLCDIDFKNIHSSNLSVLDFLSIMKSNSLLSISTSIVNNIINTHYLISVNMLKKICKINK